MKRDATALGRVHQVQSHVRRRAALRRSGRQRVHLETQMAVGTGGDDEESRQVKLRNKYKTGMSFADLLLLFCTFPAPNPQMSMIAVETSGG